MTYVNPYLADPLLGGSLGIGATGLGGLTGYPGVGPLPYASPYALGGGLASQVPVGVGAQAARDALALGPTAAGAAPSAASSAGGFASRLTGQLPSLALREGVTGRALLGRAGMGGAAGLIGSNLIDKTDIGGQNSNLEQGLQGAAIGAGVGAGVGSVVPGIGTAFGAAAGGLAGGALGVLSNMFGGDEAEEIKPEEVMATAITQANIPPDATEQILTTYDTLMALADAQPEGELRDAAQAEAFNAASAMILQAMQAQAAAPAAASNTLALQAQAQQIFEPLARDIETTGNLYAQSMAGIRDQLPESYRAISDATVARELSSSDKLANAYRAQAALTPIMAQVTRYQQDQDAYAQQLWSQQLAQQAAAMTGGGLAGTAGASDLLSQLAG